MQVSSTGCEENERLQEEGEGKEGVRRGQREACWSVLLKLGWQPRGDALELDETTPLTLLLCLDYHLDPLASALSSQV